MTMTKKRATPELPQKDSIQSPLWAIAVVENKCSYHLGPFYLLMLTTNKILSIPLWNTELS
jgi:hypothetical protein